ncbi:hypothetical protein VE03_09618 [Pseudogymnoascus sp. 23342-1-I1]|nr:hypothetical protein VE03_09618 [Pseudogymnoascus sp. 23342-1-I1]
MDDKVLKPRPCHSHRRNTSQGNPVADIGSNSPGSGLPIGYGDRSSERDSSEGTTLSQARKRQLEPASAGDLLSAKRTCVADQLSPATLLWQQHINTDENNNLESDSSINDNSNKIQRCQAKLTRKNLALLNKMTTEEGIGDELESALLNSTVQTPTTKTKTTSATMSSFANKAYENGILLPFDSKPPNNLSEIHKRASSSRGTVSPTVSEFGNYAGALPVAANELSRGSKVSKNLQRDYADDKSYQPALNQAFSGFPKDVGFNNGLSPPQPDFIEGLVVMEFKPFPIRQVSGAVLYKDNPLSIALPHISGEYKGPEASMEKARLQCAYNGAALVYARNKALALIGKPDPLGHAKITTFASNGNIIDFFVHYAAPGGDGTLEYHQYPIGSCLLANSPHEFKNGWKQLRNHQDYAREQSYALRDQLVSYWDGREGIVSIPRSRGTWDLDDTRQEPLHQTRTRPEEEMREDVEGVEIENISRPVRSTACFWVCVFIGIMVARSNV